METMKRIWKMGVTAVCLCVAVVQVVAQPRVFEHPGLTYTRADLDRMKAMVEARREPYYSTFQAMLADNYSQIGDGKYADITKIDNFNGTIGRDGRRALDMAVLYHITGKKAYADDAVKRLNRYNKMTNACSRGTAPLDNGKIFLLIEAAELLRDYKGWKPEDQAAFKKMLTYPFYSTTRSAERFKSNNDDENGVSFYWNIYQLDPGRFGNQGLFAARGLIAMGVYLDNDTIYDRGYRYLLGLTARPDDLPYRPGPPEVVKTNREGRSIIDYTVRWPRTGEQYISDEALHYYIYKNGQCQEAGRDQGHVGAGLGNYVAIAEIAWNQGDALYSHLDNRILKGIEFYYRYNYSGFASFPDQPEPWEPTGYTENEEECTYENGMFYQAMSRSGRWKSLGMASHDRGAGFATGGWKTQALDHYRVRAGLPAEQTLWLQRAYDKMMADYGYENWGQSPNWFYEWTGWGTLTKKLTPWMAGDAGTWTEDGRRVSGMPTAPCTVKAADYDYHPENGERLTYHNKGDRKSEVYRTDGTVEIGCEDGEPYVTQMKAGEWMSYTVNFPTPKGKVVAGMEREFKIYATCRAGASGGRLSVGVDGGKRCGSKIEPGKEWSEHLLGTLKVKCGAAVMRLYVEGGDDLVEVKSLRIE